MRSLDEEVQSVKSDVLAIASELRALEEKLLYPSDTQVAVFVALTEDAELELDSVHVRIDDELAASHVYSFKEAEALQKGGVQRIYTGNLTTGEHRIDVMVSGKLASGATFEERAHSTFTKEDGPELVGLTLAPKTTGGARIEVGGW